MILNQAPLFSLGIPINHHYAMDALERLFGVDELSPEMKRIYAGVTTVEEIVSRTMQNWFMMAIRVDVFTEMVACLACGLKWDPQDGFDGWGALLRGFDVAAARIQVRAAYKQVADMSHWVFKTIDGTGTKRYDILICVGYHNLRGNRLPPKPTTDHVNPLKAQWFIIPKAKITKKSIGIKRHRMSLERRTRGRMNAYWEYATPFSDIGEIVTKLAHGVPIRHDSQLSLFGYEDFE